MISHFNKRFTKEAKEAELNPIGVGMFVPGLIILAASSLLEMIVFTVLGWALLIAGWYPALRPLQKNNIKLFEDEPANEEKLPVRWQ